MASNKPEELRRRRDKKQLDIRNAVYLFLLLLRHPPALQTVHPPEALMGRIGEHFAAHSGAFHLSRASLALRFCRTEVESVIRPCHGTAQFDLLYETNTFDLHIGITWEGFHCYAAVTVSACTPT